jgi:hypothetical protein
MLGSGKAAVSAGTNAPARWISVQIGQQSSAESSRPVGLDGTSSPDCVLASAAASADRGAISSRCTWPNETASWNASANSARYELNLERDRNQRIVVSTSSAAEPSSAVAFKNFSNNVTLRQLGGLAIHLTCCKKSTRSRERIYGGARPERMSANGMVRPCSRPAQQRKLARGAKDEEHVIPHELNSGIAVIGIDFGKTHFTWWGRINVAQSCFGRSGRAGRWKHGWPTCRRV